ncbi:hypothetical protein [Candidatus Poriferisodalis sp.]|uniref:hypothetical protein n=1 Tax=Candidatus Poriferisodalis sp. TaxID=3101277 RepID=UPI003B02D35E
MVVPERLRLSMWTKPERRRNSLGPSWREVRDLLENPARRLRAFRWGIIILAGLAGASAVLLFLSPDAPRFTAWGLAATSLALLAFLLRLVLSSLMALDDARSLSRWMAEKRSHRRLAKEAAQRSLFDR